ncbi:hypothetical protein HK101_004568 [Irineochytrium annulatum]|nr:hypothetical protein HK101_004568 [Irineochytrium annulatum]
MSLAEKRKARKTTAGKTMPAKTIPTKTIPSKTVPNIFAGKTKPGTMGKTVKGAKGIKGARLKSDAMEGVDKSDSEYVDEGIDSDAVSEALMSALSDD